MGKVADAGQVSSSCEGKNYTRHFIGTKTRNSATTTWTDLWGYDNRIIGTVGEGKIGEERSIKNELGKSVSETTGDRNNVWR